jgi:hypothetical protein
MLRNIMCVSCLLAIMLPTLLSPLAKAELTDGPIRYWTFDGNGSDASLFGRDVMLQGDVGFATGLFAEAPDMHKYKTTYAQRLVHDAAYDFRGNDFTVQV